MSNSFFKNTNTNIRIGIVLVVVLAIVKFGYVPLSQFQEQTIERITVLQQAIARKKALVGHEHDLDQLVEQAKSAYESVARIYAQNFANAQALQLGLQTRVEKKAAELSVQIKSTDWLYASEGVPVKAALRLKCEGAPSDLLKLIIALESNPPFVTIDRLALDLRPGATIAKLTLDIVAYGLSPEPADVSKEKQL